MGESQPVSSETLQRLQGYHKQVSERIRHNDPENWERNPDVGELASIGDEIISGSLTEERANELLESLLAIDNRNPNQSET